MKTQPGNYRTAEQSQTIKAAYLYWFKYLGANYYYCNYDQDIIVTGGPGAKMADPQTFTKAQVAHERPEQSTDTNPRTVAVTLAAIDPGLRSYFLTIPANEILLEIYRVNSASLPGSVVYGNDLYLEFKGTAEAINFDDYTVGATFISLVMQAEREIPHHYYQLTCNYALYGTGCEKNSALFSTGVTLAAVNRTSRYADISQTQITVDSPGRLITITAETFEGGVLVDNLGNRIAIVACQVLGGGAGTRLWLQWMPPGLAASQAATVFPGCLRIPRVCTNLFNNLPNFGGMPYIPKAGNPAIDGIQT